jgi:hypothetical protein
MRTRRPAPSIHIALAAVLAVAAVGAAKDQPKGKGKGKKDVDAVVFVDADRDAYHRYWADTYGRGKCPPGLAKKGNGCLPPGQAKKRYVVGRALPPVVVVERIPTALYPRLRTAPPGYDYVMVDGDVLLMEASTRMVVDAIVAVLD